MFIMAKTLLQSQLTIKKMDQKHDTFKKDKIKGLKSKVNHR